ncbi:ABC transporter ATP-binding protein [Candidatus Nomurabacteria bacterium]|nr:ABC transporter ATP-binding protein [Candidatus Nomurabacteria bacterium]MCB9827115.1 ABC transporter ATP-binding protein [Candidatus Nomurabacteria bacterium]MCB9827843.1 ABC transporter ATP-binding protein [Candidatus Nomurabacteria bacterium]
MSEYLFQVQQVSKSFHVATADVPVLKNITFDIKREDFVVIFGPSGCGKSTLLHTMLGLEEPSSGKVLFLDKNLYNGVTEDERSDFRKQHAGMVYQQPNWIRSLTVQENVAFPLQLLGEDKSVALEKAKQALEMVEMLEWSAYIPTELSSGQQQRVALARALVTNPEVIIADEPTGNLDYESGQELMQLLTSLNKKARKTIVMVTHDLEYLRFAKTAVRMFNGQIVGVYDEKDQNKLMNEIKGKRGNGDFEHQAKPEKLEPSKNIQP